MTDNKPTSLEAILLTLQGRGMPSDPIKRKQYRDEAIAAITALLPEKDTTEYPSGTARKAMQMGYNDGIDIIHRNFTGQTDNEREDSRI